jgi:hypothetical protein
MMQKKTIIFIINYYYKKINILLTRITRIKMGQNQSAWRKESETLYSFYIDSNNKCTATRDKASYSSFRKLFVSFIIHNNKLNVKIILNDKNNSLMSDLAPVLLGEVSKKHRELNGKQIVSIDTINRYIYLEDPKDNCDNKVIDNIEAEITASEKAENERLAKINAQHEHLGKIEAERIKVENEERLAKINAQHEHLGKIEAERIKVENEERLAKTDAQRIKAENDERLAKTDAEEKAKELRIILLRICIPIVLIILTILCTYRVVKPKV